MIKCIAVDDEPLALDLLEDFIGRIPFLHLSKKCDNAFDALACLNKEQIDLMFLDIHIPDVTGIQLLEEIENKPKIIFTTAYPEHAVKGFELDAVDYLLKPFSFERFEKAAVKARQQILGTSHKQATYVFIKTGTDTIKLNINTILYIEGLSSYIKIFTEEKCIVPLIKIGEIVEKLPSDDFIRIHRSFIIPISKIISVRKNKVQIDNKEFPIGKKYRKELFRIILQKEKWQVHD